MNYKQPLACFEHIQHTKFLKLLLSLLKKSIICKLMISKLSKKLSHKFYKKQPFTFWLHYMLPRWNKVNSYCLFNFHVSDFLRLFMVSFIYGLVGRFYLCVMPVRNTISISSRFWAHFLIATYNVISTTPQKSLMN